MTNVGDLGHTAQGHNDWETRVTAQAARFGVTAPAFGGPYPIGAPDHIAVHNTYAAAITPILTAAGISATLPDEANVGDAGHVADHDLLFAAVAALEALTTPDAPTLVTAEAVPAGVRLTWSPPADDGGFPILGYRIEYRAEGAADWTRVTPDTAADASTGDAMTGAVGTYEVRVKAVNRLGAGHPSNVLTAEVTQAFNAATGGTVSDVPNYNGTGETWRVHRFDNDGTFTLATAVQPCRVLVVAGGGGGGKGWGGGGGGGGVIYTDAGLVGAAGGHPVVIGNGGWAHTESGGAGNGQQGGNTLFAGLTAIGGGGGGTGSTIGPGNGQAGGSGGGAGTFQGGYGGGAGTPGQGNDGGGSDGNGGTGGGGGAGGPGVYAGGGGPGRSIDITGAAVLYGAGAKGYSRGDNGAGYGNPGSGGYGHETAGAQRGYKGVVIVAYRIG